VHLAPLFLAVFLACGCRNTTSFSALEPPTSRAAYPDTDLGFRAFINDLLDAHARATSVQNRMHSLVIPNSSEWFIKFFGPTSGPTLDFQYRHQLGWQFGRLYAYLPVYARGQNRLVHTERCEQGHISPFVTSSSLILLAELPLRIYSASIATQEYGPWMKVGSFTYVEGNFRFMGWLEIEPNWGVFYSGYDRPFED
jgi:hypothetical protein